jgi:hypothetical protein
MSAPADGNARFRRTRDLTLVEPGLTDIWAWRPDGDTVTTTTEVMRILGGVARKN